jgi:hypothetical protein
MPAGLGALTQMGPTPKGKSPSNMGQVMAMARKLSDMQLSDVLKGLSLAVPQFAAMTEAMGRKSLRNAMQGAEAQMQAKAPNLKDKLLAEESAQQMPAMAPQPVMAAGGGLTSIPAPNMESMDMASGGIIAFTEGGTPEERRRAALEALESNMPSMPNNYKGTVMEFMNSPEGKEYYKSRATAKKAILENNPVSIAQYDKMNLRPTSSKQVNPAPLMEGEYVPPPNPALLQPLPQRNFVDAGAGVAAPRPNAAVPNAAVPNAATRPAGGSPPPPPPPAGNTVDQDIAAYTEKYKNMFGQTPEFNRRANPYEGMKYEGDDPSKVREQGMGYGFMKAAQALLTHPTMSGGMGAAIGAFGDAGLLTAKEIKAAKKDERDYNMNMAKANELFEQGQEDKAYKYQALAQDKEDKIRSLALNTVKANTDLFSATNQANYQKGSLEVQRMQANKPPEGLALLDALGDPVKMARYKEMQAAKKPNTISYETALKEYNDRVAADLTFKKQFKTPQAYYNSLQQNQENINPYLAEMQRRGLS